MKRKNKIAVSVVIPVYNELPNLEKLIARLSHAFTAKKLSFELIFIDDFSTDGSFEYLQHLYKSSNVVVARKKGQKGKAFSLIQGFGLAKGNAIVMIDADLQYPPEVVPLMVAELKKADIVVAKRKSYQASSLRHMMTLSFRSIFGGLLFHLEHDIQSGLKVFSREVIETVSIVPTSGWTFDLEFLHRAKQAGFSIIDHDITFSHRIAGASKVRTLRSSWEIGMNAIRTKFKKIHPIHTKATNRGSMIGAGIRFNQQSYITHTSLPSSISAVETFIGSQRLVIAIIVVCIILGFIIKPLLTLGMLVAVLSAIYFFDVIFNLFIVLKSLYIPQEIGMTKRELDFLQPERLPVYSILCPMYKEAHILPQFLDSIAKMDWPKDKLEVLLLLEEDDKESITKVKEMTLPSYVSVVVVPQSQPKTKPKACNYGLSFAKGEYLVVYDAEDIPEPHQLKKAYGVFTKVAKNIICLQAKLNYFNPQQNLLTRFFTAEYSLWFDITLTGLQSVNTSLPLGGTSNHFRTADLKTLHGWDPFNVTEDADLGIRLFNAGYRTAVIDSTTWEEANSKVKNWIRQRSRWIKGYMQTYLVHMRHPQIHSFRDLLHSFYFQMTIGGKIAFILINPLLWIATLSYFLLYAYVGPTIESLYPSVIFYMAVSSLVFGNFMFLYYYMIGCIKREQYSLVKFVFLIPFYWLLISIAGLMALYELFFKPHYWQKTVHGLHILQVKDKKTKKEEKKYMPSFRLPALNPIQYIMNLLF